MIRDLCLLVLEYIGSDIQLDFKVDIYEYNLNKLDWQSICSNVNIPLSFIERNIDKIKGYDIHSLCNNRNVPTSFLVKHKDKIGTDIYLRKDVPLSLYEKNPKLYYKCYIASNINITEKFIDKYLKIGESYLLWNDICLNECVPINVIEKYLKNNKWTVGLFYNKKIPFTFYDKYIDVYHNKDSHEFYNIFTREDIPMWFIEKYINILTIRCWMNLCWNESIPFSFLNKNVERIKRKFGESDFLHNYMRMILKYRYIPEYFINDHYDILNWYYLSANEKMPVTFFEKHIDKVNWDYLSCNKNIPIEFFEKYGISKNSNEIDKINWNSLCQNTNIPFWFFEKYLNANNKIYMKWLMIYHNPPLSFMKKYDTEFKYVSKNENIPFEFFEKYLHKCNIDDLCGNKGLPLKYKEKEIYKKVLPILLQL